MASNRVMWGAGVVLKLDVALGALVELVPAVLALEGLWQVGVLKAITELMPAVLPMVALEVPGKEMVPGWDRVVLALEGAARW